MAQCKGGNHTLQVILRKGVGYDEIHVAQWCSVCGSIVVDAEYDGRIYPGKVMKMRFSEKIQTDQCEAGNHNLEVILRSNVGYDEIHVVRWCTSCGSACVDGECDGRIHPGKEVKMLYSETIKQQNS